ncbi:Serine/threonine-protein phosphatase 2A activator [Coccomyxa sp. Obi]|nr:Serine/threonine-protein phosphatase 2A activator [Coccomyxa sp. Obi]
MEPTKAPWADGGIGRVFSAPEPGVQPGQAQGLQQEPHHHRDRGYLTGVPVEPLVIAEAQMPASTPSSPESQRSFRAPEKRIHNNADLDRFLKSETVREFVGFIVALNESVKGRKVSDECQTSPPVQGLLNILRQLSEWVDAIPPVQQALRYGNPAFRTWFAKASAAAPELLVREVLPEGLAGAAVELAPYLADSLGNQTRIDYGTGHETTFCALLCCLAKLGVLTEADLQALVTRVFDSYIKLMRKVQTTYWLEPAGSHGVWGLDDYQFLPFIWGSAQLIDHPFIRPRSIHSQEVLDTCSSDYMYLGCVRFVKQVKKGPLAETSPMLNDISGVPNWGKVNSGMLKMYQVEVLSKVPIMQHFLFGSLLDFR